MLVQASLCTHSVRCCLHYCRPAVPTNQVVIATENMESTLPPMKGLFHRACIPPVYETDKPRVRDTCILLFPAAQQHEMTAIHLLVTGLTRAVPREIFCVSQ